MIRIIKLKKVDLETQVATFAAPQRPKLEIEISVENGVLWTTIWSGARGRNTRARLMVDARSQARELTRIFKAISSDPAAEAARARLCGLAMSGLRSHTEIRGFYVRYDRYAREKAAAQAAKDARKAARGSARVSKLAA